jgi:hypothetical protein
LQLSRSTLPLISAHPDEAVEITKKHAATIIKAMFIIGAAVVKFTVILYIWKRAPAPNVVKFFYQQIS